MKSRIALLLSLVLLLLLVIQAFSGSDAFVDKKRYLRHKRHFNFEEDPLLISKKVFKVGASRYSLSFQRLNDGKPILTHENSKYLYNYNSAFMPIYSGLWMKTGLAVRVQDLRPNPKNIYDVGPSLIALTQSTDVGFNFHSITERDVILRPSAGQELGVEDPRIVYDAKTSTYYMFYTQVTNGTTHSDLGNVRALLALATNSKDPTKESDWIIRGPLFPEIEWSKSGALLMRESLPHYLFWGDSSIWIATTHNLLNYTNTGKCLISTRANGFDSELVESGPPPEQLSDGNYLFLYNSARKANIPNPKPDWNLEYNVGFLILDKSDPTKILYRSEVPLFSPVLDWETCDDSRNLGLTPNVVFVEGMKKIGKDVWLVWYQGCDSYTGVAMINVQIN